MNADDEHGASDRRREEGTSVVVVNWNGAEPLAACLDSVFASEPPPREVIVVDNGSTDGSREMVRERYRDVVLLELPDNPGPAAARNLGLRVARCGRVLTLDNDVVLATGTIATMNRALDESGAVAAQARSLVASDPATIHYDGGALHFAGLIALRHFFEPLESADRGESGWLEVGAFVSLCILQDADDVLALGGYDEDLEILFEDTDLSFRLRAAGRRLVLTTDDPILHGSGTAGTSFRDTAYPRRRVFLHSRNRWWYLAKNHRAWTLLLSSPGLLVYELWWFAFALSKGHVGAWCAGKLAFLRRLPTVLARRHAIQRARRVPDRELLVGGPLTLSPQLRAKPWSRRMATVLDRCLRTWWAIVRPLVV
ncbi:MAG: glycosyltransferase family 2 protein [Planctomycetota bacterium]